uniref:Lysosomal Pro-X carboxypeptidase n=1 Tax=Arion vulgaris TaxID=1028688 RepID=A0A0B6Y9F8_9EUPU
MLIFSVLVLLICGVESWRPGMPISPMATIGHSGRVIRTPLRDGYSYGTYYFDQQIDHLGFVVGATFKQRYLVADQFWNNNGGPIFFYTGNEGDIEWFCNNTGFMWDIARDFRALLVFAEHRYYGNSLPFGDETFQNTANLNYLTSEQALADFAELISFIKSDIPGAANSPVIAFGGSYGGMLAAWFRIKYPNVVIGAVAASAPIWQFTGLTNCSAFYDTASNTWLQTSPVCVANVHQSYQTLDVIASQAGGLQLISNIFKLCTPLSSTSDLDAFKDFLAEIYINYAMVDYPYRANFLADLPAWPIKVACSYLSEPLAGQPLIIALASVTNLYFNYTGNTKCVNWTSFDVTGSLGYQGWDYQSCTEMVMPMCSSFTNMFFNFSWNYQQFSDDCYRKYQVRPRESWIPLEYWAKQLQSTSNIIFSNGLLDPWSSGGVMESISDTIVAIQIPLGAHHLDFRAENEQDTRSVKSARDQETNILRNWLSFNPI